MLIKARDFEAIKRGTVDTVFRLWTRPTVRSGGTLTTGWGVLAIEAVDEVGLGEIGPDDLRRGGFADRDALVSALGQRPGRLHRIRLHYLGEDPRSGLREIIDFSQADAEVLATALARLERAGAWVTATLGLIAQHPGRPAQELADMLAMDKLKFKARVRQLKALGLTESLDVGYRLSPRGEAWLKRTTASA